MSGWTISFAHSGFHCDNCEDTVKQGLMIHQHPNCPNKWLCLSCTSQAVRNAIYYKTTQNGGHD